MRKKTLPNSAPEVASWFFTYSDVITLLMTFFILLLTFSTTEPEKFEQMQYALFHGNGSLGFAGDSETPKKQDSFLVRERPSAARMTTRGAQMPPIHDDPSTNSLAKGMAGLEQTAEDELDESHQFKLRLGSLLDRNDETTAYGQQQLKMFAQQLRKGPYDLSLSVNRSDVPQAIAIARYLIDEHGVLPGKVGIGANAAPPGELSITLTRQLRP